MGWDGMVAMEGGGVRAARRGSAAQRSTAHAACGSVDRFVSLSPLSRVEGERRGDDPW